MVVIKIPTVRWALGDPESVSLGGLTNLTKLVRPLYHDADGSGRKVRVGTIDPDHAEALMTVLDTDQ